MNMSGPTILSPGVRHLQRELYLMMLCTDGNKLLSISSKIVYPHTDFTIYSDFFEFVR